MNVVQLQLEVAEGSPPLIPELCGGVGAVWMLEEEALNELAPLCFAPETFELIGKFAVT